MKKTSISLTVIVLATMFTISSCKKGDTGPMGAIGATGSTGPQGPKDPDYAPKTSVDRFSSTAGVLMIRNSMNGLPAANAPINFDQAPFITMGKGPNGQIVEYYNFDVKSTTPAPIYVLFRSGELSPVAGQRNIINVKPGDIGYNDFWIVKKVTVPSNYVANTITNLNSIQAAGYSIESTTTIVNCPVVPEGSTAVKRFINESGSLTKGWYKDSIVFYFSFDEKSLGGTSVPVDDIYVTFNDNTTGPASGFVVESGTSQTHNIIASIPTDSGYSPLWSVNIYNNTNFSGVSNLSTAMSASILATGAALVNCPIVVVQ